jgi:hypothetical protein
MLDDVLLQAYMDHFYGYGDYAAPYWFVGMEEGGDSARMAGVLPNWEKLGRPELFGMKGWLPKIQRTWGGLIRVLFAAQGITPDRAAILHYQQKHLAHTDGETCLLELMPLPAPSTAHWGYDKLSDLSALKTREQYRTEIAPRRIAGLRERIARHRPPVVVFYSKTYWWYWHQVAGVPFAPDPATGVALADNGATLFVIMPHPTSHGITSAYLAEVGRMIGAHIQRAREQKTEGVA